MHISVPSCSLKYDFNTTRHQLHNLVGPHDASIEMLVQSRKQSRVSRQPCMEMSRDPSHVLDEVIMPHCLSAPAMAAEALPHG